MKARFDAVLFDAGGVLVLPDSTVLGPLLAYYGGSADPVAHRRAHHRGMLSKSTAGSDETVWHDYNRAYVAALGVPDDLAEEAAAVLDRTRSAWLWRQPIDESRAALERLARAEVPIGVVSNASGQIEGILNRSMCQVGPGPNVPVRCIVDSHVVGIAKPDPAIFDHALPHFPEIDRDRIAYVGDSVTMDVGGARAAGLHPVLIDPYDDHIDVDVERIAAVAEIADELGA